MLSQEIRRKFLKFFQDHHHALLPSSPVLPHDDPTLLFTNAGMNQFKDIFLGKEHREYSAATTSQKCIRVGGKHNDLDNVGHTARHLTFFEMLGNFSFGAYFKEKAIPFAWEVSTKIFGFEADHIWISIFETDEEAFELWKKIVPEKRIVRLGEADNFWAMGETGPCGPCSELYYDKGPSYGSAPSMKEDTKGERFLEFWNLVFMQFNRDPKGKMPPLPKPCIDTGSGLERVISLKMHVDTVFETDILSHIIQNISRMANVQYSSKNLEMAPAFHVIADHIRSLSFAIADGAQPGNLDRGYVLRKLLRRAVRYGKILGFQDPFLADLLPSLIEMMGNDYPELKTAQLRIAEILTLEEEAFLRTLKRGGNILNHVIVEAKKRKEKEITGEEAFKLKDTYGLPLEEILLIAKDSHLQVNLEAYQLLEEKAKELSKSAHVSHSQTVEESIYKQFLSSHPPCTFVGFDALEAEATLGAIFKQGRPSTTLEEGEEGILILNLTPFYAEKGGQVGDTGEIFYQDNLFEVQETLSPYPGIVAHQGVVKKGSFSLSQKVQAQVAKKERILIQNNHTATHLLHWALSHVLGPHIRQAGSLVTASRLRFDFNHHKSLSLEDIQQIEDLVNEKIRQNKTVASYELPYEEVQKKGEIKQFFGDKYGAKVRVIDIDFSKELCGGTHTAHTGTIGLFRIVKEASIASGVRRIEAVTGKYAEEFCRDKEKEALEKLCIQVEENKKLQQQLKNYRKGTLRELALSLIQQSTHIGSLFLVAHIVQVENDELLFLAEEILAKMSSGVLLLALKGEEKCHLLLRLTPDLVKKGMQAVAIIKEIAPLIGGSGGGKAEIAQAGGKNSQGISHAFEKVKEILKNV